MSKQKILLFKTQSTNPYFNIALENYFFKHYYTDTPIIFLWQNYNSIIIGRNQSTLSEINSKLVEEYHVKVARRLTGGGAVFQDRNNVCWTFIFEEKLGGNYQVFAKPIVEFLNQLKIPAEFQGRNDIAVEGRKVSGTAQMTYNHRTLCHGTLLFDVDLEMMTSLLNPNLEKLSSKGVDSISKRVVNLSEYLPDWNIEQFKEKFEDFLEKYYETKKLEIPPEALEYATKKAAEMFGTWEWNYGQSKEFAFAKKRRFEGKGTLEVKLNTNKNEITEIQILGDFFGNEDLTGLYKYFINKKLERNEITKVVNKVENWSDYLGEISKEDFINCIFE